MSDSDLYIGLMSGTSIDGIDAALVNFTGNKINLIASNYQPFNTEIQHLIGAISQSDGLVSLRNYGALDTRLGQLFAQSVNSLLQKANIPASSVNAIGSHGQTVYHAPNDQWPFSLQIGDPNIIAEQTGITTIADFRRRDIAAKGQGAPLVPAFHQAVFANPEEHRCIVNIGGIANITILPKNQSASVTGFDTGPGNTLMDCWINKHNKLSYDKNGAWAQSGSVRNALVEQLKQDIYFSTKPPKSTGKEYFSLQWLYQLVDTDKFSTEDIQASLCFLTASTICDAIKQHAPETERVLICGGGIHNQYLLKLIQRQLDCAIESTAEYGIAPDFVEAVAFAWLAKQTYSHLPGNLKEVTGAENEVILGGIYPGNKTEAIK